MDIIQRMTQELEEESQGTRRLLEALPEDKLTWRPHEKSMTLGQLAQHIAMLPKGISQLLMTEQMDARTVNFSPPQPESKKQVLDAFEESIPAAREFLRNWDETKASSTWKLTQGDKEIFAMPKLAVARTIMMNHLYHHRGQLTVYLRLLNVPLPATYGRSADVNPFAG